MAITRFSVDVTGAQLPSDYRQRKLATLFSSSPGENVQPFPFWFTDVIPIARGFKSIEYEAGELMPVVAGDQQVRPLYKVLPTSAVDIQPIYTANGLIYTRSPITLEWDDTGIPPTLSPYQPTVALIQARAFVYQPGVGIYELDPLTGVFNQVTLHWGTGVTPPPWDDVRGIVSNSGYLMLYTADTIYWSSPIDPLEFALTDAGQVPTGAGSSRIQALLGTIQYSTRIAGGSIIYSNKNIISVRYTGSVISPWAFVEIPNAGGVTKAYHVSTPDDGNTHYVWSTKGLITVSLTQANRILKEFTDAVTSNVYHLVDDGDNISEVSTPIDIGLHNVLGGKLIFSVGAELDPYDVAWVYDLDLNRWGRLEFSHWAISPHFDVSLADRPTYQWLIDNNKAWDDLVDVTMRSMLGQAADLSPKPDKLAVIGGDGTAYKVDLLKTTTNAKSVVLIGDVRLTRRRACTIQRVEVQTDQARPQIFLRPENQVPVEFLESTYEPMNYLGYSTANMQLIELRGDFTISALEVSLQDAGYAL